MLTFARALACIVATAVLMAGCGSSSQKTQTQTQQTPTAGTSSVPSGIATHTCATTGASELRVSGVACAAGRSVVAGWVHDRACSSPTGTSRYSCKVQDYRCLGATTARGIAVSCAQPGRSIAFVATRP